MNRRKAIKILGSATGCLAVSGLSGGQAPNASSHIAGSEQVAAHDNRKMVEIWNDKIKARFIRGANGIQQNYFARKRNGSWALIVTSLVAPTPRPFDTSPLYSDQPDAREVRILASSFLNEVEIVHRTVKQVTVDLRSRSSQGNKLLQRVTLNLDESHFHVEINLMLPEDNSRLEYVLSSFQFEGGDAPDFTHVPHMKRAVDDIIGDRAFDSPAVIIQHEQLLVGLLPDLDLLNKKIVYAKGARPVDGPRGFRLHEDPEKISFPAILDLDLRSGMTHRPVFSYGLADYITEQHVYWRHENRGGSMVRQLSSNQLQYGFDLILSADAPRYRGYQQATKFLWNRYGSKYIQMPRPQVMPLVEYAKVCLPAAFAYRGDSAADTKRYAEGGSYEEKETGPLTTWLEFEIEGKPVGGIRANPTQWYNDIQYSAWWNNARDAVGLYWWGQRLDDPKLQQKARRMVNLALAAPQNEGIFPSVYRYSEKRWIGCYWKFPQGFNTNWKFSDKWQPEAPSKFWDFNSDSYMTAASSLTGVHLLRYNRLCENDPRLVPYLKGYGEFLLKNMSAAGTVPSWFSSALKPSDALHFSAEGGVHIWFLAELYQATHDERCLRAASRMATFLSDQVIPHQRWSDFETFYSCARKPENVFDENTMQWPQCTLSMMWAIQGLTALAKATGDSQHRSSAEAVGDYSLFYQASWQPHFITTAYAFGGFRSQNSDAEWLDMRSSGFGEALAELGSLTGRQDHYERAVAAMHSAFAAINHPRLIDNGVFRYPRYPIGLSPENIDHDGLPQDCLRSGFDWGEGGALSAAAEMQRTLGGLFVDGRNNVAIGIDGASVQSCKIVGNTIRLDFTNQLAELPVPWTGSYATQLRVIGLGQRTYQLILNGSESRTVSQSELLRFPVQIDFNSPDVPKKNKTTPL